MIAVMAPLLSGVCPPTLVRISGTKYLVKNVLTRP